MSTTIAAPSHSELESYIREVLVDSGLAEYGSMCLQPVTEASENSCWLINDDLVIRINPAKDAYNRFCREACLKAGIAASRLPDEMLRNRNIDVVREQLQSTMPVIPEVVKIGSMPSLDGQPPAAYAIDRRLHGTSLENAACTEQTKQDLRDLLLVLKDHLLAAVAVDWGIPEHPGLKLQPFREAEQALERMIKQNQLSGADCARSLEASA